MRFAEVRGHEAERRLLSEALHAGRLPHALLLAGPEGTGKFLLARAIAATRLCERAGADACGACGSCRRFAAGTHPDHFLVEPRPGRGTQIPIAAIRGGEEEREGETGGGRVRVPGLLEWIARRPAEGRGRCATIRDANRMNAIAQNALLKTLEEPPPDSLLVLTAPGVGDLLETVVSRCLVVRLRPLPDAIVARALEEEERVDPAEAARIAEMSGGSLGDAIEFVRGGGRRMRELAEGAFEGGDPLAIRDEVYRDIDGRGTAADRRARVRAFLRAAAAIARTRWRDAVAGGEGATYLHPVTPASLEAVLESAGRSLRDLEGYVEPGLLLDLFAYDLAGACKPTPPSATD